MVIDAHLGERENKQLPVVEAHGLQNVHLYEGDEAWINIKDAVGDLTKKFLCLNEVYPDGFMIPRRFIGENIVHLPTVKTHVFTTTTGAMKNAFGGLLNERRHWTHPVIHETLVDLLMIQKKIHRGVFAVMDGTFAGDGPGPRCMVPHVKNVILASADQVAIDAVAAKLMGIDPLSIKFIRLAHDAGLGCGDPRDIEIVGDVDAANENWHFDGPFREMTFASRMQHKIYWGPLRKPIEWSLKTVLAPWAYIASVVYHDSFWYPLNADRRMTEVLSSPWGRLFQNWETLTPDADGFPTVGDAPAAGPAPRPAGRSASRWASWARASRKRRSSPAGAAVRRTGPRPEDFTMSDFHVRSDAVDVEQIMEQIRRRIRDKRGVDYTEEQVRELATVRLEKFLDPKNLRSDLLEQFRKSRPPEDVDAAAEATYEFEDDTLYDTHRGLLRTIRRWFNPLLKLFFNPNTIVNVLHQQADLNRHFVQTTTPGAASIARPGTRSTTRCCTTSCSRRRAPASSSRTSRCGSRRCRAGSTSRSGASAPSRAWCSTGPRRWRRASGGSSRPNRRPAASSRRACPARPAAAVRRPGRRRPPTATAAARTPRSRLRGRTGWAGRGRSPAATPVTTAATAATAEKTAATTARRRVTPRPTLRRPLAPPPDADPLAS